MERRSVVLLDATVPIVVGAVILAVATLGAGTAIRPNPMALELAAAATLAGRRRAPLGTLVASAVLVLIVLHIDARVGPVAVLAPAVGLFALALTRGRRQQLVAAGAAVALVVLADVLHTGEPGIVATLAHVALVSVPLLAAEALRTRRSNLTLLVERVALTERSREQESQHRVQQERLRIARDLHDVVAHTLTTINVQAATAAHLIDRDPHYAKRALETIEDASRGATAELRALLGVLRDSEHPDPPRAPAPDIDGVPGLVQQARAAGLDVTLQIEGERPDRLLDAVSLAAYRIVQESLTNVHRHAVGAPVQVRLHFGREVLSVAVQNGAGATAGEPMETIGVGITGMTERAESLGGKLSATPLPLGFRVDADLPYALGRA